MDDQKSRRQVEELKRRLLAPEIVWNRVIHLYTAVFAPSCMVHVKQIEPNLHMFARGCVLQSDKIQFIMCYSNMIPGVNLILTYKNII